VPSAERGCDNRIVADQDAGRREGRVVFRERLGRVLRFYYQEAA